MGQKSRVGRPSKNTIRVELRLNADHPMTTELKREAETHHVSLQQYIIDILLARYMRRRETREAPSTETPQDSSSKLADEWM